MIDVITHIHQIYDIKPHWDILAKKHKSPLLGFEWFLTCAETIHKDDQLHIVIVREGCKIQAIAPLCLVKKYNELSLELLGASTLYEPSGFLYADKKSLTLLLKNIARLGYPLSLLRLPDDPVLFSCLRNIKWRRSFVLQKLSAPSLYLELPYSIDVFLETLSPNRRYDFRRKQKCLEKKGRVATRIHKPNLSEVMGHFQQAIETEDKSWKARCESSLLRNKELRYFFESYLIKICKQGLLRTCFIEVDGIPVSMHIAVEYDGTFWVLKLGYDESHSKCSPGALLAMKTIEYCIHNNIKYYEFLGSEEEWQHAWPVVKHDYYTVLIFPYSYNGLKGLLRFVVELLRGKIYRLLDQYK